MTEAQENVEFRWKPNPSLQNALEWIQEYKAETNNDGAATEIVISIDCEANSKAAIVKTVQELESHKDEMAAILEHSGFGRDDSAKAVRNLIADMSFYAEDHWDFFSDEDYYKVADPIEFSVGSIDIPIIGRLLGPSMRLGSNLVFNCMDEKSSLFWAYLVKILVDCGSVTRSKACSTNCDSPRFYCGGDFSRRTSTPVIVFEACDIFAAVRTLVQTAWEFNGETYWAPTHVYVQESLYDSFLGLLKSDSINHLELIGVEVTRREATASEGHPEIFQPCDSSHFKFFLGWDPKALGNETEMGDGIAVLPFRTVDEAVLAANALPDAYCASLWTEKLKFGPQTAARLKMNTVWINCHGVLDPYTSFASDSSLVPFNGPHFFEMLLAISMPTSDTLFSSENFGSKLSTFSHEKEVLEEVESLPLMNDTKLRPLKKLLSSFGMINLDWARQPEFAYRVTESGMEITSHRLPGVPQYVALHCEPENNEFCLAAIAYFLVSRGRAVLWALDDDEVKPLVDAGAVVRVSPDDPHFESRDALAICDDSCYVDLARKGGVNAIINHYNLGLIPHFSHFLIPTKNVFVS